MTQGGIELPYFSSDWKDTHKYNGNDLMNVYEKTADNKDIFFPFYEVLTNASTVKNVSLPDSTDKARFYQFSSKENNLYFNSETQQLEESQNIIKAQGGSNIGFFPFDQSNNDGSTNNLGFGARFDMKFKLSEDGTVKTLNADGKTKGTGKVHTMFEFDGDDDLWVFIDNNLVLDLGGVHTQTKGLIDFYDGTATAYSALKSGTSHNGDTSGTNNDLFATQDNWVQTVDQSTFITKITGASEENSKMKYNPDTIHTLTVFYMERGMFDSNLLIRFNYAVEANVEKMKIQEETDFSAVNDGLVALTKKAAEDDVFQYTVKNNTNTCCSSS